MVEKYITIFTPTYNRKSLLGNLYKSLCRQECKDFEWIIVDDDSNDGTEDVVQKWILEGELEIKYYRQTHGGKHRAINKGVQAAKGIYFFIVDSDDTLTENAVLMAKKWGKEVENREDIAGVSGMRFSKLGVIGGSLINKNREGWVEASNLERERYHLLCDKAEIYKLSILKQYPFPEFEGEDFLTEAVCWDAIAAAGYKLRWYDYPIYQCEYLEGGLTKSGANGIKGSVANYQGCCYYTAQCLKIKKIWDWAGCLRKYNQVAKIKNRSWIERARDIKISVLKYTLYTIVLMPAGYGLKVVRRGAYLMNYFITQHRMN